MVAASPRSTVLAGLHEYRHVPRALRWTTARPTFGITLSSNSEVLVITVSARIFELSLP